MYIKSFLNSENGAVSVDWVVITGGLVGLGLATMSVVSAGVEDASLDISQALINQDVMAFGRELIVHGFTAATAALNETSLWNDPNSTSTEFNNVDQLSFSTEVQFSATDEGILFEAGGTGRGFILYQTDGVLYLQAGSGSGTGATSSRGEASWAVADGTHTIEGSMNADGGLALYVNGELVGQSSFTAASLAGGNAGSISGGTSSVAINRGGFNASTPGHPGVTEVAFYEDQTTGDELVPMN